VNPPEVLRRERTPALTRDLVVDRAVAIADAEGLEAVTVRRVAQDLEVTPMALYWHVSNKDELLAAMGDRIFADLTAQPDPAQPWIVALRALTDQLVRVLAAHPRLAPLATPRILATESGWRFTDAALGLLHSAGFEPAEAMQIARHILRSVLILVVEQDDLGSSLGPADREELLAAKREALAGLSATDYPYLVRSLDGFLQCDDDTDQFDLTVDLLMAGIEALAPATR
jgi:AcrR family transcriptional regulator